jgi:hypothetical protein
MVAMAGVIAASARASLRTATVGRVGRVGRVMVVNVLLWV